MGARFDPRRLLRLYPRPWRERYGDEMLALLDEAGTSWPVIFDLARGAVNEQGRHAWRLVTGTADPVLTTGQLVWVALIGATGISFAGWWAGQRVERFVPDALDGLHMLFGLFVLTTFYIPAPDVPPVYVVHPLHPERLLRVRAPFRWPRVPARWRVAFSTVCFIVFAVGQGTISASTTDSRGFFHWFWSVWIAANWVMLIVQRPNAPARTSS